MLADGGQINLISFMNNRMGTLRMRNGGVGGQAQCVGLDKGGGALFRISEAATSDSQKRV